MFTLFTSIPLGHLWGMLPVTPMRFTGTEYTKNTSVTSDTWQSIQCAVKPIYHVFINDISVPMLYCYFEGYKVLHPSQQTGVKSPKQPARIHLLYLCLPLAFMTCCPRTLWVVYCSGTSWCTAEVHLSTVISGRFRVILFTDSIIIYTKK